MRKGGEEYYIEEGRYVEYGTVEKSKKSVREIYAVVEQERVMCVVTEGGRDLPSSVNILRASSSSSSASSSATPYSSAVCHRTHSTLIVRLYGKQHKITTEIIMMKDNGNTVPLHIQFWKMFEIEIEIESTYFLSLLLLLASP